MLLFALFALVDLAKQRRSAVVTAAAVLIAIGASSWLLRPLWIDSMSGQLLTACELAGFLVLIAIGLPIAFVLLLVSTLYLGISGVAEPTLLVRQMNEGISRVVLLAIPMFILAGLIMARGGPGERISQFVGLLLGHFRGGPLQAIIVSMFLFSGLSGSKSADIVAVGTTMTGAAHNRGYTRGDIAATLNAAAVMGETIPPSIAMLLLGSITSVSVATLVLGACLMLVTYLGARAKGMERTVRPSLNAVVRQSLSAIPALLLPVILSVGLRLGLASPTEISAYAVIYGFLVSAFWYRGLSSRDLFAVAKDTSAMTGMILCVVAASTTLSWSLSVQQVSQSIADAVVSTASSQWEFMLLTIATLIVLGAFLEGAPALIIFAPLLMPVATRLGINPVHYAVVLIIAMGYGAHAPPIGVGLYVACLVAKARIEETVKPLLPYLLILLAGLILIALVPSLSLALPALFGKH
jgi:tripartite ATP-independent transporter DctM subunit